MFDFEKMMKPVFEKYIPSIVDAFEKNKKKDYLMRFCLEKSSEIESLESVVKAQSAVYDKCMTLVEKELSR